MNIGSSDIEIQAVDINDEYEHIDSRIDYILENVLGIYDNSGPCEDKLKRVYNSVLLNGCDCNDESRNCNLCPHGRNYEWNSSMNELVLVPKKNNDLIYECNNFCNCDPVSCINRLVQKGPRKELKIVDSCVYRSKGLITTKDIPKGGFVCEYAGELLTQKEAIKRLKKNENVPENYILFMNELIADSKNRSTPMTTIIDPTNKGNIGRYLNHSCDPNCEIFSVRVDCPIPKVGIFAKRFINVGEELCIDYNEGNVDIKHRVGTSENQGTPCLCRTSICSGYLPSANI